MSGAQPMRVKVLVLPVYKRHWMFHAWLEGELASGPGGFKEGEAWWRHGSTVQDKVQALTFQVNQSVNRFVDKQWTLMAAAQEGTFRSWMYKLALGVLSQEDPNESFLKKIPAAPRPARRAPTSASEPSFPPVRALADMAKQKLKLQQQQQPGHGPAVDAGVKGASQQQQQQQQRQAGGPPVALEVIYPASLDERLVRRRLRLVALRHAQRHKRGLIGWTLACIPQLPLMITPLPNVTVYYTVYRIISHLHALNGANCTKQAMDNSLSWHMQALLTGRPVPPLQQQQHNRQGSERGRSITVRELPGQLGLSDAKLLQLWASAAQSLPRAGRGGGQEVDPEDLAVAVLVRSEALDAVVSPLQRWQTPLDASVGEVLASRLGPTTKFNLPTFIEHLGRVRRVAGVEPPVSLTALLPFSHLFGGATTTNTGSKGGSIRDAQPAGDSTSTSPSTQAAVNDVGTSPHKSSQAVSSSGYSNGQKDGSLKASAGVQASPAFAALGSLGTLKGGPKPGSNTNSSSTGSSGKAGPPDGTRALSSYVMHSSSSGHHPLALIPADSRQRQARHHPGRSLMVASLCAAAVAGIATRWSRP